MTAVSGDLDRVELELAAGALLYPACGGRLARWERARTRPVGRGRRQQRLRPRRSICRSCGITHVLLALCLGTGVGWAVTRALAEEGMGTFDLPAGQLLGALLLAVLAGAAAAVLAARSAARLDVLRTVIVE